MRLRSVLFSPADKPDRVHKVLASGAADVVVADLEDGVAPGRKEEARRAAADVLASASDVSCLRAVRINVWPGSLAEADLEAVLPSQPDLIVVPKVESVDAVRLLDARLTEAGADETRLLLILETAKGVLHAEELATASDRVVAIAFGAEDLSADVGIRRSPDNREVSVPRALIPLAAAAAGVRAIDMITADYQDVARCKREASEARDLGYVGKMCIHPGQLDAVHAAFAPTPEDVAWATKVVAAADAHGIAHGGVVSVDGQMVDVPLVEQARRILTDANIASGADA